MKDRFKIVYALELDGPLAALVRTDLRRRGQSRIVWQGTLPLSTTARQELDGVLIAAAGEHPVFSIPVCISDSVFRWLSTPFPSIRKAKKVFPSLLNVQLPFDLAHCRHTFLSPHEINGQVHALALAVRDETLQRTLDQAASLGMDPQIVQHEGLALWQETLGACPPEPSESRVVACLGVHRTILLYGEGSTLRGAQQIAVGQERLTGAHTDEQAAWAAKALLFIRSQSKKQNPLTWMWCGPGANEPEPIASLERCLTWPEPIAFRRLESFDAPIAQAMNRMLATRPAVFHNFRCGPFAHPQSTQQYARAVRNTRLWLYLLGVFLCAAGILWQAMLQRQNSVLDRQLENAVSVITGGTAPKAQEVAYVSRILEDRRASCGAFSAMTDRPAETLLTRLLALSAENHIRLERLSIQTAGAEMKGSTERWETGALLEAELQRQGYKTDLQRQDAGADERVHFTLKGIRREAP